jgi:hypothetical protein
MNPTEYDITCARCFITITGKSAEAVNIAFRGHEKEAHGYMTGQEFYNRFREELRIDTDFKGAVEAARKAAGLEQ